MRTVHLLVLLLLVSFQVWADDSSYNPTIKKGSTFSLEGTGSLEIPFTGYNTASLWGGAGMISMFANLDNPTYKYDVAVEVRHYFKKNEYSGFNLGLYAGLERISTPAFFWPNSDVGMSGDYLSFVPGIKLSYTSRPYSWLLLEPFIGVSTPWYGYDFDRLHNEMRHNDPAFILNVGVRVGFYQLLKIGSKK